MHDGAQYADSILLLPCGEGCRCGSDRSSLGDESTDFYCCHKLPDTVDDDGHFFLFFLSRCQRLTRQLSEQ